MNANNILFRCSSIGHLMTEPRSKSESISETTKTHLVDVFVAEQYGRHTDVQNKYTSKGQMVEEDSITLYSTATETFYRKNETHFSNEWIRGTPDIVTTDLIIDIKSSWDIFTFNRAKFSKLNQLYYWQVQGYMWLTGRERAKLVYCLIDTPYTMVEDEKRRLMWKMGAATDQNEDYLEACELIERNLTYGDIPIQERFFEIEILRDEQDIGRICSKVENAREYMNANLFNQLTQPK